MIAAYVGAPGHCKTYSLSAWLLNEMWKGNKGVSQYAVHGAEKLEMLGDLLHEKYRGAAVAIDEVGRILPARDWSNEDEIETALLETHRHHGLEIRYACQDIMQASVALRRLTEYFIFCIRLGPDPSRILKSGNQPHWWQCPIGVRQVWVRRQDIDGDGIPKPLDKCEDAHVKYIWWRRNYARLYDTTERIYPGLLQDQIEHHLASASERIALNTPWEVKDGHSEGTLTRLYRGRDEQKERKAAVKALSQGKGRADSKLQEALKSIVQGGPKGTGSNP